MKSCIIITDEVLTALRIKKILQGQFYDQLYLVTSVSLAEDKDYGEPELVIMDAELHGSITALKQLLQILNIRKVKKIILSDLPLFNLPRIIADSVYVAKPFEETDLINAVRKIEATLPADLIVDDILLNYQFKPAGYAGPGNPVYE